MTTGIPRDRRDQYRVWKRIYQGVRSNSDLADQLKISPQVVAECKADACVLLWELIVKQHKTAAIDELCDREHDSP